MDAESTLSSYHIFNAVAEAGNLSKAAKTLYISQPAISRAVSKLEQNLSVKLFIRGSRGVHLTEEGKLLYAHTKSAFDALRQGEENLRRINHLGISKLRIGASSTLYRHFLMPQLQQFVQEHPHLQISLHCHSSLEITELLAEGKLDIGLISEPSSLHSLEFLPVAEIEDIFVATEGYIKNTILREDETISLSKTSGRKSRRTAEKKASDSVLSFFRNGTLMLLKETNYSRSYINQYFNKNQLETGQILEFDTMEQIIDFSKIGLGIGCVIKNFVQEELKQHLLTELPLPANINKRRVGFAYRKTSLQSDIIKNFINFYKGDTR